MIEIIVKYFNILRNIMFFLHEKLTENKKRSKKKY